MKFNFFKTKKRRIYLDYAATTPVCDEVFLAMRPFFTENFGNASAIYAEGMASKKAIEEARRALSDVLKVRKSDVIFTSGGTESNHLAIHGVVEHLRAQGRKYEDMEILSTRMEHPSVIETLKVLEERGVTVRFISPDMDGLILETSLEHELSPKTVLVTFSYVNSEIGVVQDVKRIARIVRKFSTECGVPIRVHLDASQAPLWLSCQMDMLGVDLITLDAGKCYGPKGAGVLAYRHDVTLSPQQRGGGQEFGLRAGTENTALIVGAVTALIRAQKNWEERSKSVAALRDAFLNELLKCIPGVVLNGSRVARVANNVNISIPGVDTEFAVVTLDAKGISASTKSACSGASGAGSKVVLEISSDPERAISTLRFTLGEQTIKRELDVTLNVLREHVEKMSAFKKSQGSTI